MKKIITLLLFTAFAVLCGAEILPKFMASAQKEAGTVLYVRSSDKQPVARQEVKEKKDYQKLLKGLNVNGA